MAIGRMTFFGLAMVAFMAREGCVRGRKMTELTEDAAGRPVSLKSGSRVRVALREVGGTGYRWRVGEGCAAILRLEQDETEKTEARPGASVERAWVYTATGAGTCELRFESVRSWEKSVTGKVVVFPVTVEGRGNV